MDLWIRVSFFKSLPLNLILRKDAAQIRMIYILQSIVAFRASSLEYNFIIIFIKDGVYVRF